jgi:hypothetical protein
VSNPGRRAHRACSRRRSVVGVFLLCAVANVVIFGVFGGFLTYPLLALVGDMPRNCDRRSALSRFCRLSGLSGCRRLRCVTRATTAESMAHPTAASSWPLFANRLVADPDTGCGNRRGGVVRSGECGQFEWVFCICWEALGRSNGRMPEQFSAATCRLRADWCERCCGARGPARRSMPGSCGASRPT